MLSQNTLIRYPNLARSIAGPLAQLGAPIGGREVLLRDNQQAQRAGPGHGLVVDPALVPGPAPLLRPR